MPTAVCSSTTSRMACAAVIAPARTRVAPTTRLDAAVEARMRRVTGRITRKTASAPIQSPSGRKNVATACASCEMLCAVETVRPTGLLATVADFLADAESELGTWAAPLVRPLANEPAPDESCPAPLANALAPDTSAGPAPASFLAPAALCEIPDWMPPMPAAVCELRVVP